MHIRLNGTIIAPGLRCVTTIVDRYGNLDITAEEIDDTKEREFFERGRREIAALRAAKGEPVPATDPQPTPPRP